MNPLATALLRRSLYWGVLHTRRSWYGDRIATASTFKLFEAFKLFDQDSIRFPNSLSLRSREIIAFSHQSGPLRVSLQETLRFIRALLGRSQHSLFSS